jgi:hypothetical protein
MGIGDNGRGTTRKHGPSKLRGRNHRGLDVDVGIDESRADIAPFKINLSLSVIRLTDTDDSVPSNGNVSLDDLAGEYIDNPSVAKQKVSRFVATGDGEKAT